MNYLHQYEGRLKNDYRESIPLTENLKYWNVLGTVQERGTGTGGAEKKVYSGEAVIMQKKCPALQQGISSL
jgi:hypothetical protein